MARKARKHSKTGIYHIIIRGMAGESIFAEDKDKFEFIEVLRQYKDMCGYRIYGYCILDNHLHLLLEEGEAKLSNIMKRVGVKYVNWYNDKYDRTGQLFYDRFKSEPVESDEYLLKVLRFIQQEPVRLGLVMDINRYEFSSQHCYNTERYIVDTGRVMSLFDGALVSHNKYMAEPVNDDCMEAERSRVSDEVLQEQLLRLAEVDSAIELKKLPKPARNKLLKEIKELSGASVWQLSRVSGFSQSVIAQA